MRKILIIKILLAAILVTSLESSFSYVKAEFDCEFNDKLVDFSVLEPVALNDKFITSPTFKTFHGCGLCEVKVNDILIRSAFYLGNISQNGGGCDGSEILPSEFPVLGITKPGVYTIEWTYNPIGCGKAEICPIQSVKKNVLFVSTLTSRALELLEATFSNLQNAKNILKKSSKQGLILGKKIDGLIRQIKLAQGKSFFECNDEIRRLLGNLEKLIEGLNKKICSSTIFRNLRTNKVSGCIPNNVNAEAKEDLNQALSNYQNILELDDNHDSLVDLCNSED
ncbi:MAG: hypothetical protein HYY52_07245 [Candidatus Melainabacteria bacterium]|nr:hypothetical protein [Candidatus Melainabacteria bacterium]